MADPTPSSRPSWPAHRPSPRAWVPFPDDFWDWDFGVIVLRAFDAWSGDNMRAHVSARSRSGRRLPARGELARQGTSTGLTISRWVRRSRPRRNATPRAEVRMIAMRPVTGTRLAGWASKLARCVPTPSSRPSWLAHSPSPRAWVPFPDDFWDWDFGVIALRALMQWLRRQHTRPRERAIRGSGAGSSVCRDVARRGTTTGLTISRWVRRSSRRCSATPRAEVRMIATRPVTGTRLAGWASKLARGIPTPKRCDARRINIEAPDQSCNGNWSFAGTRRP